MLGHCVLGQSIRTLKFREQLGERQRQDNDGCEMFDTNSSARSDAQTKPQLDFLVNQYLMNCA
jgi:hypothetical protein